MDKLINKKIKNNHGVSILFSLLLLMVVSMVSAVIIAFAVSSANRNSSVKNTVQNNMTVDSAVILLKDNIDGAKCTTYINNTGTTTTYQTNNLESKYDLFSDLIKTISETVVKGNNTCSVSSITISATNLEDVKIDTDCTLNSGSGDEKNNTVIFTVTSEDSKCYVTFDLNDSTSYEGTRLKHDVTWQYVKASNKETN